MGLLSSDVEKIEIKFDQVKRAGLIILFLFFEIVERMESPI